MIDVLRRKARTEGRTDAPDPKNRSSRFRSVDPLGRLPAISEESATPSEILAVRAELFFSHRDGNLEYSDLAARRMGILGSASFQSVKKSL